MRNLRRLVATTVGAAAVAGSAYLAAPAEAAPTKPCGKANGGQVINADGEDWFCLYDPAHKRGEWVPKRALDRLNR